MNVMSFDEARERLLSLAIPVRDTESVAIEDAWGRVLAEDLHSPFDVPGFDNSAMDGYALRFADLAGPGCKLPVSQRVPAGSSPAPLQPGTAARIFTGAPVPAGADTVVMQEFCRQEGDAVCIDQLPKAGEFVRRAGEDLRTGQVVLEAGTRITPARMGLIASIGLPGVKVIRPLKAALFFTGSELLAPGEAIAPGKIYNSNRYVMRGFLAGMGAEIVDLGIVPDSLEATRAALRQAAEAGVDIILTSGGMSEGEEDHVKNAVEAEGQLDVWKIAAKPGKPLAYGSIGAARFIGMPGNPVSVWVAMLTLVQPYLRKCQGMEKLEPTRLALPVAFGRGKAQKRREFVRVKRMADGRLELFPNQDSGVLSSAAWADGVADIPAGELVSEGQLLDFWPITDADFS